MYRDVCVRSIFILLFRNERWGMVVVVGGVRRLYVFYGMDLAASAASRYEIHGSIALNASITNVSTKVGRDDDGRAPCNFSIHRFVVLSRLVVSRARVSHLSNASFPSSHLIHPIQPPVFCLRACVCVYFFYIFSPTTFLPPVAIVASSWRNITV